MSTQLPTMAHSRSPSPYLHPPLRSPVVVAAVPAADALRGFRLWQRCMQPPALQGHSGQHGWEQHLSAPQPRTPSPAPPALPCPALGPHPSAVTLRHYTEPRQGALPARVGEQSKQLQLRQVCCNFPGLFSAQCAQV